jgi:hypothetical protein
MFINIMVATVAADPAVAREPRDHLVRFGFQLRHGYCSMRKYLRIQRFPSSKNTSLIAQHCPIALFVRPFFPGLSQSYTGATAVLVDELDAGGF